MFINLIRTTLAVAVLGAPGLVRGADVAGSGDHPLIPRYPASEICAFEAHAYDEYRLVDGPAVSRDEIPTRAIEGRILRNMYVLKDEERSVLEVMRNYEIALEEAGFAEVFRCAGDECAEGAPYKTHFFFRANPNLHLHCQVPELADWSMPEQDPRYYAGRLQTPDGEIHVAVTVAAWHLSGGSGPRYVFIQADVVETEAMRVAMELKLAEEIDADIGELGRAAIYGILFATDKADIEPESRPALAQIARFLQDHPTTALLVVGHTDDQGTLEYNLDLSRRRAESVVRVLVEEYGIEQQRLAGHGVGYLAPAASNASEEGRARNRRVELVPRGSIQYPPASLSSEAEVGGSNVDR